LCLLVLDNKSICRTSIASGRELSFVFLISTIVTSNSEVFLCSFSDFALEEFNMENTGTSTNKKRHPRRRVADSISKSPAPSSAHPKEESPATKLLAALSKAQGKSAPDPLPTSKRHATHGQKSKTEPIAPRQKLEPRKKGSGSQNQNVPMLVTSADESMNSVGLRTSRHQATVEEVGPSTSNARRMRDNSYSQANPITETYSLWSVSPTKTTQSAPRIPHEVLQDLTFRFLANIPDEEKSDKVRMCFQVELAHWFYVDFYCKQEARKDCAQMGMREFARQIFKHCDELAPYAAHVDQVIDEWRWYKSTVPTYGAILLDESLNHVLLVQGFYASKNSWGFPKGKVQRPKAYIDCVILIDLFILKVNEGEEPRCCAIREVFEETGFNFGDHRPHGGEKKLQKFINETMVRLYIVPDVPTDFPFAPQTRNEIRKIQWFNVWDLPTDRNDQFHRLGILSNHNFYTVMPFVQDLQKYIVKEQERRAVVVAERQRLREPKPTSLSSFGDSHTKDISAVMDALFSASVFPNSQGAAPAYGTRRHTTANIPAVPSLAEAISSGPTNVPSLASQMATFSPRETLLDRNNSRFTAASSGAVQNPPHTSHFRPLDQSPLGKSVLNVLAGSGGKVPRGSTEKAAPQIAHPIAIPAQQAPPPFVNRPVYVAPKEKPARISLSETSAFTAFKSPSMSSSIDITAGATEKIEMELHKLLCGSSDISDSTGGTHAIDEKTPTGFLDSFRHAFIGIIEFAYLSNLPCESNHTGVGYVLPYARADGFIVQLCDAWKDFKLDRNAIFVGLPGFETAR
ncbi:Dcp2, box A domain protein, partial [Ancylostoma caninum]